MLDIPGMVRYLGGGGGGGRVIIMAVTTSQRLLMVDNISTFDWSTIDHYSHRRQDGVLWVPLI